MATKGRGGIGAFVGVCVISAALGIGDAHVQGGMVGDLSLMCPEFIQVSISKYSWCFVMFFGLVEML